jgi:anti-sigma B factor antagonist
MVPSKLDPNTNLVVTMSQLGPAAVLHVTGEIDMATCDAMAEQVFARMSDRPSALVIDLSGVDFLGSAGLGVLIEASQRAQEAAMTLRIVATTRCVLRPLEISGLLDVLPVYRGLADALQGLTD